MTSVTLEESMKSGIQQEQIAPLWTEKGFSCELWIDLPGAVWENQRHEADELLMPVTGLLEIDILGQLLRPDLGEEVLIPAGTSHSIRNLGRSTACWLYGFRQ